MEYLKDNKFIKMEIKAIKMWKLIKYESDISSNIFMG